MSCWSLESPLSFMLAGMEGLRPRQRAWQSGTPTSTGSPAAWPALLLPDNPKPTTRPQQRAPTGRRGRGRAPTAPPASCCPAPRVLRRRVGRLRQGGARACAALPAGAGLCVPAALGPGAAASVWYSSGCLPVPRGPVPSPTALQGCPAAPPLAGQRRSLPLGLAHRLPSRCLSLGSPGRRLAASCFHGRRVHRGWGIWRV